MKRLLALALTLALVIVPFGPKTCLAYTQYNPYNSYEPYYPEPSRFQDYEILHLCEEGKVNYSELENIEDSKNTGFCKKVLIGLAGTIVLALSTLGVAYAFNTDAGKNGEFGKTLGSFTNKTLGKIKEIPGVKTILSKINWAKDETSNLLKSLPENFKTNLNAFYEGLKLDNSMVTSE